jgi:hypothetical protein
MNSRKGLCFLSSRLYSRHVNRPLRVAAMLFLAFPFTTLLFCQTVLPLDPNEGCGQRPYEMVWANRQEPAPPTVRFDHLDGWIVHTTNAAQTIVQITRAQNVWDRPVVKLRYRGEGKAESKPSVTLRPPQPIPLPEGADCVEMWVYGNRWDWEHPPDTPPLRIVLHLRDASGNPTELSVDNVRWQEWWLLHKKLPSSVKPPLRLDSIEFAGGWQPDWREIFVDSIRFFREELPPIQFKPRPRRNLNQEPGELTGANTGPGRLPFPTRETTILPMHFGGKYSNGLTHLGSNHWVFDYHGRDAAVSYYFNAVNGLNGIEANVDGHAVGRVMDDAGVRLGDSTTNSTLLSVNQHDRKLVADYSDGTTLRLEIRQKSLLIEVLNPTRQVRELSFGRLGGVTSPRLICVPYLTYGGGPRPCVLLSHAGTNAVFSSLWLDWYRSNGSEPYAAEATTANSAQINGGVRYFPRTDGERNPVYERLFVTVSPRFEEVLPSVSNPTGLHAHAAVDRLWQESWGPDDFEKQMQRSRMLRAYGIEKLIQCNHEIAWRDGGESFTLRTRAAPKRGGDAALQRYVAHQRGLGWFAGLYSNYTDYSPVNEFWSPDGVQRQSDGSWRSAWPRCWAEKPLKAVEFDAVLAPQIKRKFNPNSAYTDVHTAVSPWGYNDYDARVPGAGTFAQTFYAYGELLRNDSRVYGGPIFSEGTYHWLYAGLADGNYALAYDGHPLAKEPLLPVFDLYQIHTKECDIGMGWTANFCDAIPDWKKPEHLDYAIDRFMLHTLAYGHIGWLVEEEHGIARTCRSYYMLQQVQARYGLKTPTLSSYWDGNQLVDVSEALVQDLPRTRRQLMVEYPGGLQLWLNDHPTEDWTLPERGRPRPQDHLPAEHAGEGARAPRAVLPPAGWAVFTRDDKLLSLSALHGTNRFDYLSSPPYTYLDARGANYDAPEASTDGALAIRPLGRKQLRVTHIYGEGPFTVRRPYKVRGKCSRCEATDVEGKPVGPITFQDSGSETRITSAPKAVNYVLTFE